MTLIDDARAVSRIVRGDLRATVKEFFPAPSAAAGAQFGRKLGLWLTVGAVVAGVAAAVITVFTED
jgi:hypothetical protein